MKKNNLPTLSIVTPSYNQGHFIKQTIESVLAQKDPKMQYWVIDGGSKDETLDILKKYQTRLKFVSEKDRGQTDAINKGILKTLGKPKKTAVVSSEEPGIFAYLNSDDYYLPGSFKLVRAAFAAHPEKMWLVGDAIIVNAEGQEIQPFVRSYKRFWRALLSWFSLTILNPIPQPAVFIRSEAVLQTGLFSTSLKYVMDYEYWLRLYQAFGAPLQIQRPLAAFRIHSQSKGSTSFDSQFAEGLLMAQQYTQNWLALLSHRLHNQLILWAYYWMK
jgi:glycosyltransferase involved in cell wall biosynthesis